MVLFNVLEISLPKTNFFFFFFFRYVNVISQFNLRQEFADLYQHLKGCDLPIVFCHNDLLIKNIIYNDKTGKKLPSLINLNFKGPFRIINILFYLCQECKNKMKYFDIIKNRNIFLQFCLVLKLYQNKKRM